MMFKLNAENEDHHFIGWSVKEEEDTFDEAFRWLLKTISPEIQNGKTYDMNILLKMFKNELEKKGNLADSYTKQNLKVNPLK